MTIGATGVLFVFARPQDKTVQTAVTGPHPPFGEDLARVGTWLGDGVVLFPAMGAAYGLGWLANSEAAVETGAVGLEALALGGIEADILKYSAGRRRPDYSDRYSFPSGHATEAFSAAAVLASEFGWSAGAPAYLAAAFVGYSRLQNNNHWLSDVVAGAGLGILAGRAAWRVHHRKKNGAAWSPWIAPSGGGLRVSGNF